MKLIYYQLFFYLFFLNIVESKVQDNIVSGTVSDSSGVLPFANVFLKNTSIGTTTDQFGNFNLKNIPDGEYTIVASFISYVNDKRNISIYGDSTIIIDFTLELDHSMIDQIVVTSSIKPVSKLESAVPVEVYTPTFLKYNPSPSIFESMQNINGVRPQVNCSVCNTGDIHINGLEGAYTMVMIDGMPIVSGLSTVYGLNGIPQSIIERIEIVKGPASTLYGSEAVAGLINVITKKTERAPIFATDIFGTSWGEMNTDFSGKFNLGDDIVSLLGINYFNFKQRVDNNNDNFTDVTLQDRVSIFNKLNFKRKRDLIFTIGGRYIYEDRFGGELDWTYNDRGGDIIYGESIFTGRWEVFGVYQLPFKERILLEFSANQHDHNSVYGNTSYIGNQKIGFGQLTWNKQFNEDHDLLFGLGMRYTYYDDNTPATSLNDSLNVNNFPSHTYLPGVFVQDEIKINDYNKIFLGIRYDNNSIHGNIFTPRFNYKWSSKNKQNIWRIGYGTGYRVANVFTEDHAALSGTREVVFLSDLNPEKSYNININYLKRIFTNNGWNVGFDASLFYTNFNNKIYADYESDLRKIIYDNLSGYAVSNGLSINTDISYEEFKLLGGITLMNVYSVDDELIIKRQELTEKFTATWTIRYFFKNLNLSFNYNGNLYSPMILPTQDSESFDDPRPSKSPWWSLQSIQLIKNFEGNLQLYFGIKNLLNWTPWKNLNSPYLGNTKDPFIRNTPSNVLIFDPSYVYAPNQGIRFFVGIRYGLN